MISEGGGIFPRTMKETRLDEGNAGDLGTDAKCLTRPPSSPRS
ncbi:MAG: hypothetical protein IPI83_15735 [Sphingomonadales bacterium]|nr:hypothetical protein [Sphingomonadales bacterium]